LVHEIRAESVSQSPIEAIKDVEATLQNTEDMTNVKPAVVRQYLQVLPTLRISACPPLAV